MENLEFHPLAHLVPDPTETIAGALALAKREGTSRQLIARVLELEEILKPRWTISDKK